MVIFVRTGLNIFVCSLRPDNFVGRLIEEWLLVGVFPIIAMHSRLFLPSIIATACKIATWGEEPKPKGRKRRNGRRMMEDYRCCRVGGYRGGECDDVAGAGSAGHSAVRSRHRHCRPLVAR